jgi:hypothetical protein
MTNDKQIPYQPLNRLGFEHHPSKKLAYSHEITFADEKDLNDVWSLSKFHHFDIPFKDALCHLLRNPRNICAISLLHQSLVPQSSTGQEYLEGQVLTEDVAGFVCIAPVDAPCNRTNVVRVNIRALYHNLSLGEEQIASLIYEALHQYCAAKISTDVPTKLEADIWLSPTEATFFRTVYGYLNNIFQDSYAPLRLPDVGYETTAIRRLKEEAANKAISRKWNTRKNLNDPQYWHMSGDHHTLIFPRLPGPAR